QTQTAPPPPYRYIIPLIILACVLAWLAPAYKRVSDKYEEAKKLSQNVRVVTVTERIPVYIGGTIAYRESTSSHAEVSTTSTESSSKSHEEITKRGTIGLGLLYPGVITLDAGIIGPFGIQTAIQPNPFRIMAGVHLAL